MGKSTQKYTKIQVLSRWFRGLNTKIIIYFISFGFLPLLVFSVLGYYLNKDMITRVNNNNLRTINKSDASELQRYLQHKFKILENAFSSNKNENTTDFYVLIESEFIEVVRKSVNQESILLGLHEYSNSPFLRYTNEYGTEYRGYLPVSDFQSLIFSDTSKYAQRIFIPEQYLSISPKEIKHLRAEEVVKISDLSNSSKKINRDANNNFTTYDSPGGFGYTIITSINASAFFAELESFRNKIFLGNAILAFMVLILSIVYSTQITTPIRKLIKAIQHIGRGNLENRIELQSNDEIQILANEFEIMRQKLSESYQGMEEKIQARTRQLQEAQVQISHQEKMASLGLMAAGIAHEIGNPLTSISSLAQVIRRKSTDDKIIEHVNNILKSIERISRIVHELVDFSKPSIHQATLLDVNEIINSAVGIIKYDRRSKHMSYDLDLNQNLPQIKLVADHLLQVLLNILINAVDASEGYGNEIQVLSFNRNGSIHIEVQDKGCGIPAEEQNKIFEPFYTTKEVGKGTGLGLSVSYGLIKKMNGKITVQSTVKKGSTFTVILPVIQELEG
jgi:signal transduction histidine kinase